MIRILFRYQKVYFAFTRGTAKSFTQLLAMYLKCIFFPGTHLFICAATKEQAAKISQENIEKIWDYYPILYGEIKGKPIFQKDYTKLFFLNGSKLDVVIVANAARGGRRNGGSIEEIVDPAMNPKDLNEVVLPLMANDRLSMYKDEETNSRVDPSEIHKNEWYITTCGTRQSFAYEKLKEITADMLMMGTGNPVKSAFSIGAGYELAAMYNQLSIDFINDLRERPTYSPLSFAREYESVWTGSSENSLVQLDDLKQCRTLDKAEERAVKDKNCEYVLSYDVARAEGSLNALCALVVIKIIPRGDGTYQKHVVNIYSFEGTHFREQALFLKKKVVDFRARMLVVDVNQIGKGLVDELVLEIDENPPYQVVNDDRYDKYKTANSIPMIYGISSNTKENKASDVHNIFMGIVSNHKVKMLYTEAQAKEKLDPKVLNDSELAYKILLPFVYTDLLQEEIMNLEYKGSGNSTQVKQVSSRIQKDKFSALEYGLYYINTLERKNAIKKKENFDVSGYMLVKKPTSRLKR